MALVSKILHEKLKIHNGCHIILQNSNLIVGISGILPRGSTAINPIIASFQNGEHITGTLSQMHGALFLISWNTYLSCKFEFALPPTSVHDWESEKCRPMCWHLQILANSYAMQYLSKVKLQ